MLVPTNAIRKLDVREAAPPQVLRRNRVIGLISGIVVGAGLGYLVSIPLLERHSALARD
ncbi:MAG TPA: hypothetical protein VGM50_04185 [Gemmatimonadaceae bacterium]